MAAQQDGRGLILPAENEGEVGLLPKEGTRVATHLLAVCAFLLGQGELSLAQPPAAPPNANRGDLQDIIGQEQAKRALEIAAAGGHNLLLLGPPGTGKTMLASRLPGLLPPLTDQEALESVAVASLQHQPAGRLPWRQRPFRAPHHSASMAALVGGGCNVWE
ncbi:Competence protein ComM [Serratia rubidaea]|uniref:Competence protein ComM n=1 Tax=Serratia rubidaea TaxID=61652 RepID=A0A447QKT9_SERRU|nr:Competence protein ComM [Serratia rubidaea]